MAGDVCALANCRRRPPHCLVFVFVNIDDRWKKTASSSSPSSSVSRQRDGGTVAVSQVFKIRPSPDV